MVHTSSNTKVFRDYCIDHCRVSACLCVPKHPVSYSVLVDVLEYSWPLHTFKLFLRVDSPILSTTQYWSIMALVHLLESVSSQLYMYIIDLLKYHTKVKLYIVGIASNTSMTLIIRWKNLHAL